MDCNTFIKLIKKPLITDSDIKRYLKNQGYVYLIHAVGTNRYKIGRTVNPIARFTELKKQSPYPLQIVDSFWTPDAVKDETNLHTKIRGCRVYGEWFENNEVLQSGCSSPTIPDCFDIFSSKEIWDLSHAVVNLLFCVFNQGKGHTIDESEDSCLRVELKMNLLSCCTSIKELQACIKYLQEYVSEFSYEAKNFDCFYIQSCIAFRSLAEGIKIGKLILVKEDKE